MAPSSVRALHFVIKVADRTATVHFLHDVLGMHALRHEEFKEGCKAACNGPYSGMWSKTMMGYDSEDSSFVLELTYNYDVKGYRLGNDHVFFKIRNRVAYNNLEEQGLGSEIAFNVREVRSPDGHVFRVLNEDPTDSGYLASVCLAATDLERSVAYWADALGFLEVDRGDDFAVLSAGAGQATLRLTQLPAGTALDRGTGYGRIAFSCPAADLAPLQEEVQARGYRVLTPLVSLETPGKAAVQVVILADPDGHEICFVGDEAFRQLSVPDDNAPTLLQRSISLDGSREWLESKQRQEGTVSPKAAAAGAAGAVAKAAAVSAPAAAAPAAAAKPAAPPAAAPAVAAAASAKPAGK